MSTFITNLTSHPYANVWVAIAILIIFSITSIYFSVIKPNYIEPVQRQFIILMASIYLIALWPIINIGLTPYENPNDQSKIITVNDIVLAKTPTVTDNDGKTYKVDVSKELKKGDKLKIQLGNDNVWRLAED